MVSIKELPITGAMKEHFERFLNIHPIGDITFNEVVVFVKDDDGFIHPTDPDPQCSVCGHALKYGFVYRDPDGSRLALGTVCASNYEGVVKWGSIEETNFHKIVRLEKKTMMKRLLEAQAEQGKIILETKYHNEITWLYSLIMTSQEEVPELWAWHFELMHMDSDRQRIWDEELKFFWSLYGQIERRGKLSEQQIIALNKAMQHTVDDRITRMQVKLDAVYERWRYGQRLRFHTGLISRLERDRKTAGVSAFLLSLKDQAKQKDYLTDKQLAAIRKIYYYHYPRDDDYMKYYSEFYAVDPDGNNIIEKEDR